MKIRELREDEVNMVMSDWCKSYARYAKSSPESLRAYVSTALRVMPTLVYASDKDDIVGGWACGNTSALMYVYVRYGFRGMGIARALHTALGSPPIAACKTRATRRWDMPVDTLTLWRHV